MFGVFYHQVVFYSSVFYSPINDLQSYLGKSFLISTIPFTAFWWHLSLWSSLVWLLPSATSETVDKSFAREERTLFLTLLLSLVTASVWSALLGTVMEKCICSLFKSLHIITSSNFLFLFAVLCSFSLTLLTTHQFFTDALTVICACSAVCWNSSPFTLPFHWKSFEECWRSCSLLVNDEVCRGRAKINWWTCF